MRSPSNPQASIVLIERTGITSESIASMLLILELEGTWRRTPAADTAAWRAMSYVPATA